MYIDNILFLIYNKIMETNIKPTVAENKDIVVDNVKNENAVEIKQEQSSIKSSKKPLTPYQKYKNSRNQNGKKYFDFYDDIKVYTHNIYDW